MAIPPIGTGDGATTIRDRTNAAITAANAVDGKVNTARLAVRAGLNRDAAARPGDNPEAFTSTLFGSAASLAPLAIGTSVVGVDGKVRRLVGAGTVARRQDDAIEPGKLYVCRWAMRRTTTPADPAGHAVRAGVRYLDANMATLTTVVVYEGVITVASGLQVIQATFSPDQAANYALTSTVKYVRPFIQTFGEDGAVDISVVDFWPSQGTPGPAGAAGPPSEPIEQNSWAALSAIIGKYPGQPARSYAASGTHVDPVTGATVSDRGQFAWSVSPAGWARLGDLVIIDVQSAIAGAASVTTLLDTDDFVLRRASDGLLRRIARPAIASDLVSRAISGAAFYAGDAVDLADDDLFLVRRATDGALLSLSKAKFNAWIGTGEMAAAPTFTHNLSHDVGNTGPQVIVDLLAEGQSLVGIDFQVKGEEGGKIAIAFGGLVPSFEGNGSWVFYAGETGQKTAPVQGIVRAIADRPGMGLTLDVITTAPSNPNIGLIGDTFLQRLTGTYSAEQRLAMRTLYMALYDCGALAKAKDGYFAPMVGASNADRNLNWAAPGSGTLSSAPVGSWRGYTFDGVDDALAFGKFLEAAAGRLNHTVGIYSETDSAIQGANHYAMGDSQVRFGPGRSATQASILNFTATQVVTMGGLGLFQSVTRTAADRFISRRDGTASTIMAADNGQSSTSQMIVGGVAGSSGFSSFYTGRLSFAYMGEALTADEDTAIRAAIAAWRTASAGW